MPEIEMPRDLGAELSEAARWYAGGAAMEVFCDHVRAGHSWSERRPRQLLLWAERHAAPVFGHQRFVVVLNAGFACPQQRSLWRTAKVELRRTKVAIACGEESGMIYCGGRELLAFAESGPRRWGAPESALRPSLHASPSGPLPAVEPPSPPPSATEPSRPRPLRGQIVHG